MPQKFRAYVRTGTHLPKPRKREQAEVKRLSKRSCKSRWRAGYGHKQCQIQALLFSARRVGRHFLLPILAAIQGNMFSDRVQGFLPYSAMVTVEIIIRVTAFRKELIHGFCLFEDGGGAHSYCYSSRPPSADSLLF